MKTRIAILISVSLLLSTNFAFAGSWAEVARFSEYYGTAPFVLLLRQTSNFTCDYSDWRIVWSYVPIPIVAEGAEFNIAVYRSNETIYFDSVHQGGNIITNGTTYIHEQGRFYLTFLTYNVLNSTAIIEQNVGSLPEISLVSLAVLFGVGVGIIAIQARTWKRSNAKVTAMTPFLPVSSVCEM